MLHLVTELEEQWPNRFTPPALCKFGLGHALHGHRLRPSEGVGGTVMKAPFACIEGS